MKIACTLGVFGLLVAIGVSAQPPADAAKSTGQKGQLVPAPFRSYIVTDERLPANVNDDSKALDLFLEALKKKDITERKQVVVDGINSYEKQLQDSKTDPMKLQERMKEFTTHVEEWFAAYQARNRTDHMHDLICEHGLNPIVAVFVREEAKKLTPDSGVGDLAKKLNALMTQPEYRGAKLAGFVIFLKVEGPPKSVALMNPDKSQTVVELDAEYPDDEKRDDYREEIRDLAGRIAAPNVVYGLAPAKSKAAAAWAIADDDAVTVVVLNRIRVLNRWKCKADGPTPEEIKQIIGTVEESIVGVKK